MGANDLTFQATNLLPDQPAMLFVGHNTVNNGDGAPFGDGLRCAGGELRRLGVMIPDMTGTADWGPGLSEQGMFSPGATRRFQVGYRDPTGSPCASGFNLSNGYEVVFTR